MANSSLDILDPVLRDTGHLKMMALQITGESPHGEFMKLLLALAALSNAATSWGQPVLRAANPVGNASSYATSIAQGSIFVVIGTNLGSATLVQNTALPFRTTLSNASIRLTPVSGGAAVDAYMVYTTQNQLAGLLPSTAALGGYDMAVTYNGQTSGAARVTLVAAAFGIVSADSSGGGQAQAQQYRSAAAIDLNRPATGTLGTFTLAPARPGQVMVLWGTGLGADALSDSDGLSSGDQTSSANVRVIVGSREIVPVYAGRASGLPGTDQINFMLPADVDLGCFVNVAVRVGSNLSNALTIATAANGATACTHPSLTEDQLRKVSQGGSLTLGSLTLIKTITSFSLNSGPLDVTVEGAFASFAQYGIGGLSAFGNIQGTGPSGECVVTHLIDTQDQLSASGLPSTLLDAGAQLTLNGPNSNNIAITRGAGNRYTKLLVDPTLPGASRTPSAVIAEGLYTISGTGGADVGGFSALLNMPALLDWTNKASITDIVRSGSLTVTWTGGGNHPVFITGISGQQAGGTALAPILDFVGFTCTANGSAGTFTVPSSILSQLPATGRLETALLGISMYTDFSAAAKFTAPLIAGGSIDSGLFDATVLILKDVNFR